MDGRHATIPPDAASSTRALVAFVAIAYAVSWSLWVPLALSGTAVEAGMGWPSHLPGLLGPALAAVIVTAATRGRAGLADLGSRIVRWRVGWYWYALIAATAALAPLSLLAGDPPAPADLLLYSGAPAWGLAMLPYVVVINGLGEETGWRGFLAHGLLARHSRAVTALIVWPVWALWHAPLFWVSANFRELGPAGTVGWVVGIGFGSVLLTWLYDSAERSILVVALWHTAYNLTTATEAAAGVAAAVSSTVVMAASVAILLRRRSWARPP
ncbi:CPBP family intramembrane glutamic endopeptidase [Demequina rhizosphaerae]|uniref:CPBP family intramembrane glutamic endopeptidase n=1 Tax=Demequina rhizosphaerae TaxID=1638985 RepID=UPI00078073D1|nr:type II CAAX endopeptidase family protein [Demequina rhizosphaerae]